MQVWLNDSEVGALITTVRKEVAKTNRRASAAYRRANAIQDAAYTLDSLAYSLEDALRSEMSAFDN